MLAEEVEGLDQLRTLLAPPRPLQQTLQHQMQHLPERLHLLPPHLFRLPFLQIEVHFPLLQQNGQKRSKCFTHLLAHHSQMRLDLPHELPEQDPPPKQRHSAEPPQQADEKDTVTHFSPSPQVGPHSSCQQSVHESAPPVAAGLFLAGREVEGVGHGDGVVERLRGQRRGEGGRGVARPLSHLGDQSAEAAVGRGLLAVQVLSELADIPGEDVQVGHDDFVWLVSLRSLDAGVLAVDLEVDRRGFALGYLRLVLLEGGAEGGGKHGAVEGSLLVGVGWHARQRHLLALAVLAHKYIRITTNNSLQPVPPLPTAPSPSPLCQFHPLPPRLPPHDLPSPPSA